MKIEVSNVKTIGDVQQEFHAQFPFLKIEFLQANGFVKSVDKNTVSANKIFGAFRENHSPRHITIVPSLTVTALDKEFRTLYGLGVLIFRKSGKAWLETKLTDNWTLQEQNEQGKALSS